VNQWIEGLYGAHRRSLSPRLSLSAMWGTTSGENGFVVYVFDEKIREKFETLEEAKERAEQIALRSLKKAVADLERKASA